MHETLAILRVPTTKYELEKITGKSARAVAATIYLLRDKGWIEEAGKRGKAIQWQISELGTKELLEQFADAPVVDESVTKTWKLLAPDYDKETFDKSVELREYMPTKEEAQRNTLANLIIFYKCLIDLAVLDEDLTYLNSLK